MPILLWLLGIPIPLIILILLLRMIGWSKWCVFGAPLTPRNERRDQNFRTVRRPKTSAFLRALPGKLESGLVAPPPGSHDELEVGLKRPSGPHLILIDRGEKTFEAARGPSGRRQSLKVKIERAGSRRDVRVGGGNTKLVLRPPVRKADEFDPGVCVIVDKVAVGRAVGSPREDADAAVVVPADAI